VRRQPYNLVLFGEMEKTHPSVFFNDGISMMAKARTVDLKNTIIILRTNWFYTIKRSRLQKNTTESFGFRKIPSKDCPVIGFYHNRELGVNLI
jgi:ATP-dependent Clp protease ATP-binding subunit ClpA